MQLTQFDRWLRAKFVHETHVQTLRPVEARLKGVRHIELPETPGRRYCHLYIARSSKAADELIACLRENGQMYQTTIMDRKAWYVPIVAPKDKSVTWKLFSLVFFTVLGFLILIFVKSLVEDPEFRKNFLEAIDILRR